MTDKEIRSKQLKFHSHQELRFCIVLFIYFLTTPYVFGGLLFKKYTTSKNSKK
jgi:hypothetical protein